MSVDTAVVFSNTERQVNFEPLYITIGRQVNTVIQDGISVQTRTEMIIRIRLPFFHLYFIILCRAYRNKELYKRSTATHTHTHTHLIIQKMTEEKHVTIHHCEFYLGRSNGLSSSVTTYLQKLAVKLCSAGNRMFQDGVSVCVTRRVSNASRL
jgi:hypothetical protein